MRRGRRRVSSETRAARATRRRRVHRHQSGLTLIETIVTIALLAVGIVGITAGVAAAERTAAINQDQAQLQVAMRQLADFVRDSNPTNGLAYNPCAQVSTAVSATSGGTTSGGPNPTYTTQLAAKLSRPSGVGQWGFTSIYESTSGQHDGTSTTPLWSGGCPAGTGDWGVQEIQVTVFDALGTRSLTRTVWKSYAWCYQGTFPTGTAC